MTGPVHFLRRLRRDSPAPAPTTHRSRRGFLATAGACLAAPMLSLPRRVHASPAPRALSFVHTHTGESLALTYAVGDSYVPRALATLEHFLRDFRNGRTHAIDPSLLDQLHALAHVTATSAPFQVISAYRSPATNRSLREGGHGVALNSLHLTGQAIDIRLADVALADLHGAALSFRAGGVGYYPGSDFVHIDTGRVRSW
jgi:uncharacterized protein YcbK (DUF882 family)